MNRPSETGKEISQGSSPLMAEAVFKNIQVLKGVSSDQLIPAMRFLHPSEWNATIATRRINSTKTTKSQNRLRAT